MLCQPEAYSNIVNVNQNEFRSRLAAQLFYGVGQIMGSPVFELPEHNLYLAHPRERVTSDKQCPVYVVRGVSASRLVKPNISLPLLSEIEKKYLKKYLNGKEIRTDHKYFKIDNGEKIKCPNPHFKNVRLHEFKNIVRKSGLTVSEYFDERKATKKWKKNTPRKYPKKSLP